MQTIRYLDKILSETAQKGTFVFGIDTLATIFAGYDAANLRMIASRAVKNNILTRVCSGVFLYAKSQAIDYSSVLYKTARLLRNRHFNYLSLESVLSDASIISQQMFAWITVMTTGRSGIIDCGKFGHIEFVHTAKKIDKIMPDVSYDLYINMFRATPKLAYADMRMTRRPTVDLVDTNLLNEYYASI